MVACILRGRVGGAAPANEKELSAGKHCFSGVLDCGIDVLCLSCIGTVDGHDVQVKTHLW
jgi:hypothetical protein